MYIDLFGFRLRHNVALVLALAMIMSGISILLVLFGILDPPGYRFWLVVGVIAIFLLAFKIGGIKGLLSILTVIAIGGTLYLIYLLVLEIFSWFIGVHKQVSAISGESVKTLLTIAIVVIQIIATFVLRAEGRISPNFLKGYQGVIWVVAATIMFASPSLSTPFVVWGVVAIAVTLAGFVRKVTNRRDGKANTTMSTVFIWLMLAFSASIVWLLWLI